MVLDGEAVRLSWEVMSETNNAGFYVERHVQADRGQPEGKPRWEQIGFVEGRGTATTPQTYVYDDTRLPFEARHAVYRLRQLDFDAEPSP